MIFKTMNIRKFFGISFLGALSMLLLSTSLETPAFASNISEALQKNQNSNLIAKDDDRDDDKDDDRDDDRDDDKDDDDDDDRRRRRRTRRLQG